LGIPFGKCINLSNAIFILKKHGFEVKEIEKKELSSK